MRLGNLVLAGFALGLFVSAPAVLAAETATKTDAKKETIKKKTASGSAGVVYSPPMRGAPAARIGGGTRGIGDATLELVALAPDHTGLTTKEQPTLYWYVSEPVQAKLEVTLINDESIDPDLEQVVSTTGQAGIQRMDLAKTRTRLVPGMEYRWFVSVVAGSGQRSNDIVASGTIQRITPDAALKKEIAGAEESALMGIYARQGIWYDAIDVASRMIDKSPGDSDLQEQRAALLDQVGLQAAADYARAHAQ
jgi:hypothetical protein